MLILCLISFALSKLLWSCRSKKPKPAKPAPKPAFKPKLSLFDEEDDPDKELFQPAVKSSKCDFRSVFTPKVYVLTSVRIVDMFRVRLLAEVLDVVIWESLFLPPNQSGHKVQGKRENQT